jgi:hypothetical protein
LSTSLHSEASDYVDHPFVKFSYGADVHLHHRPSGVTLHLHSCFFGDDLDARTVENALGGAKHLSIGQIIDFFELIEFEPGKTLPTTRIDSPARTLSQLLVAATLGLDDLVEELETLFKEKTARADFVDLFVLVSLVKNRRAYPTHFIRNLLLTVAGACKVTPYRDIDDDEFEALAMDDKFGVKFALKLVAAAQVSSYIRNEKNVPNPGSSRTIWRIDDHDDATSPIDPRGVTRTKRWRLVNTAFIKHNCTRDAESLCFTVKADTGFISVATVDKLPFSFKFVHLGLWRLQMINADDTLSSVFGEDIRVGSAVIVHTLPTHPVLGVVTELTANSFVLRERYTFNNRTDAGGCILHVAAGVHAGFHRGWRNIQTFATVWVLRELNKPDPFMDAANFVIRIRVKRANKSQHGMYKWRSVLVHDWVMYRRWPYFRSVIDSGMEEAATKILTLPKGFTPELLRALVQFIYTDKWDKVLLSFEEDSELHTFIREYGPMFGFGKDEMDGFNPRPFRRDSRHSGAYTMIGGGVDVGNRELGRTNLTGRTVTRFAPTGYGNILMNGSGLPFPDYDD